METVPVYLPVYNTGPCIMCTLIFYQIVEEKSLLSKLVIYVESSNNYLLTSREQEEESYFILIVTDIFLVLSNSWLVKKFKKNLHTNFEIFLVLNNVQLWHDSSCFFLVHVADCVIWWLVGTNDFWLQNSSGVWYFSSLASSSTFSHTREGRSSYKAEVSLLCNPCQ